MQLKKLLLFLLCCLGCSIGASWTGFHLFFLSIGYTPLEISEPNIWIARTELLFALLLFFLGIMGYSLIHIGLSKYKCPLCGNNTIQDGKL